MNKYLDLVQPNMDKFGLLTTADYDGGDTILNEADLVFCAYFTPAVWDFNIEDKVKQVSEIKVRFKSIVPQFVILDKSHKPSYGLARRHPDLTRWYSHWDRFSRDQMYSMLAMAVTAPEVFDAVISNWRRRGFLFATNTLGNGESATQRKIPDLTGPGFWAYAIRCGMLRGSKVSKWLRPFLTVFDINLLLNSIIRVYILGKNPTETDSRNHIKALALSKLQSSTWLSKLARLIYRRMPIKFPDLKGSGAQQEIDNYFKSNGGVSGLAILYAPVVEWILS